MTRKDLSRNIAIAPSVLPADFSRFGQQIQALDQAGADRIHFDVMDGSFVPNLTFGPDVIASVRDKTDLFFEAHLMVNEPSKLAHRYVEAGCEMLMIHQEACTHLHRCLGHVQELGAKAALVLNPATPPCVLPPVIDLIDMVLLMTVNPGFGGQPYLSSVETKIAEVNTMINEHREKTGRAIDLEVDGGIGPATISAATSAGANVFVAGSALFKDPLGLSHAIDDLRSRANEARS